MAAREQTHDAGILKSLGFSSGSVFIVLLLQSLFLTVFGGGLGVLFARGSSEAFATMLGPNFPNYGVSDETVALGLSVSLLIGLLAGIMPAYRLSRSRCIESLRAEG